MPVINVSPTSEPSQCVVTTADVHATEEELNTPIITPLGTPVSPLVDSDDLTEMLLDVPKTQYVDADSTTEDVPLSLYVHISNSAVVSKTESNEPIVVSSSDGEENLGLTRTQESANLQKQILVLRRKEQSYLRQLVFWVETVAKLGSEHDRPPSKLEHAARKKLLTSGDWPIHMIGVDTANFSELGPISRGGSYSLSSD